MAKVLRRSGTEVTLEVTVDLEGTLLEMEGAIQEATNALGCCVTEEARKRPANYIYRGAGGLEMIAPR